MRHATLFAWILLLAGCASDDLPCSPGGEGLPPGEPVPEPVPGPTVPPDPGDFADPEAPHGYARVNGEVCVCDARDAERLGCTADRPPDNAPANTGPCDPDVYDPNSTINCGPAVSEEPEPQTPTICGELFWCCLRIRCENGATMHAADVPLCPKDRGYDSTRAGAWQAWQVHVKFELKALKIKNDCSCWIQEASCYHEPTGGVCFNYPN